ncbi:MAG: hypothetical protein GC131_07610 [Alphaproteobacteria bacterium]|nr:hypothetical protein [Alphaproteobacteria bacterium]
MNFLQDSLHWFTGQHVSHMGPHQYMAHKGMRYGKSTSGITLWAEAEGARNKQKNMVSAETALLHQVSDEINKYLPSNLPIVELGPGTLPAFVNKTLPILRALKSKAYIPVDESVGFLKQVSAVGEALFEVRPIVDDFFAGRQAYYTGNALICSFGSTISNILSSVSNALPETALTEHLAGMAVAANSGWLLIGFDSNQNGKQIIDYFNVHSLFQLNIFDRMAAELPMQNFDPLAFDYDPLWIPSSGQLAHIAVVSRNINFSLAGRPFSLTKGQKLHIKNSYKYDVNFFQHCCNMAGLERVKVWSNESTSKVFLLRKTAGIIP